MLGDAWGYEETTADPEAANAAWARALEGIKPGLSAVSQGASSWQELAIGLAQVANTIALTNAQRRLLNVQIERARNGQPPLDSSQYGLGVNLGISPSLQSGLLLLGVGALVLFALKKR